ncbi:MAG: DUF2441 domain-containing protein [Bacteroidales bacterium]|nr:DUF2441 domain-containing protein [Bacteroidales bacterium]
MKNTDITYYHIQRLDGIKTEWNKNVRITIGKNNFNEFFNGVLRDAKDYESINNKKVGLIEYSNHLFRQEINKSVINEKKSYEDLYYAFQENSFTFENLADKLHKSLFQYLKWIREEIFEQTRLKINTNLPSRKNCIWISDKKDLHKWWELFKKHKNKKILQLKLNKNGKTHQADGTLVNIDTFSIKEFESRANDYWYGKILSDELQEILYEGEIQIVAEYRDINEIEISNT